MPQYPMPPWPEDQPAAQRRSTRLGVNNPRYADLPVVTADVDGTLTIVRGGEYLVPELAEEPGTRRLYEYDTDVGQPHFVVRNRLGRVRFVAAERPVWVGLAEFFRYTDSYQPFTAPSWVSSLEEAGHALLSEYERAGQLAADGWELTRVHDGPNGLLLVDTRRPDEDLTPHDLP